MLAALQKELIQRKVDGLLRQRRLLDSPQAEHIVTNDKRYLSFCSNDYLGLANHPKLIAAMQAAAGASGVGSGASNLITGHHRYHDSLEKQLAEFVQMPAALLFSTGYMANLALLSACPHLSPTFKNLCERLKSDWDELIAQKYGEIVAHQREHMALH